MKDLTSKNKVESDLEWWQPTSVYGVHVCSHMTTHIRLLTYVCAHTPGMHEESKNWVSKDFFFHVTLKQDSATSIYIVTTYARYCRSFSYDSYDLKVATDVHGFYAKWYVVYMRDLSIQSLCTLGMTWSACVKLTTVSEHHWFFGNLYF